MRAREAQGRRAMEGLRRICARSLPSWALAGRHAESALRRSESLQGVVDARPANARAVCEPLDERGIQRDNLPSPFSFHQLRAALSEVKTCAA